MCNGHVMPGRLRVKALGNKGKGTSKMRLPYAMGLRFGFTFGVLSAKDQNTLVWFDLWGDHQEDIGSIWHPVTLLHCACFTTSGVH
jgi:hypothetical protein